MPACVVVCECLLCPASFTRGAITQCDNRNLQVPTPHTHHFRVPAEVLYSQIVCAPVLASLSVVYRQQLEPLEICIVAIPSTHVTVCAELDRATSALDDEDTPVHMYTVQVVEPGPFFLFLLRKHFITGKCQKTISAIFNQSCFFYFRKIYVEGGNTPTLHPREFKTHPFRANSNHPFTRANSNHPFRA